MSLTTAQHGAEVQIKPLVNAKPDYLKVLAETKITGFLKPSRKNGEWKNKYFLIHTGNGEKSFERVSHFSLMKQILL